MKFLGAYIKPEKVQIVTEALTNAGFASISLFPGEGTGAFKEKSARASLDFHVKDSPVVKLELNCKNEKIDDAIKIARRFAKTNQVGDSILYTSEIERGMKIKNG